jgi:hypothetical protein
MEPSSRTPEGQPNICPVCGKAVQIEPSCPPGDAPCPHCGHLLWFAASSSDEGSAATVGHADRFAYLWRGPYVRVKVGFRRRAKVASRPAWGVRAVVLVGAAVGLFGGLLSAGATENSRSVSPSVRMCIIGASTGATIVFTLGAALGLSLRDRLRRQLRVGSRVNPVLRLYFASGGISLLLWIATAIGLTFLAAMALS